MHLFSRFQAFIIAASSMSLKQLFKMTQQNLFTTPHSASFGALLPRVLPNASILKSTILMLLLKKTERSSHFHMRLVPNMYEHALAALMIYSDGTHLAQFGSASLCPLYAFFGNQSKYDRAKPSHFAAHHVAYMPSVRDSDLLHQFCDKLLFSFQIIFKISIQQPSVKPLQQQLSHS